MEDCVMNPTALAAAGTQQKEYRTTSYHPPRWAPGGERTGEDLEKEGLQEAAAWVGVCWSVASEWGVGFRALRDQWRQ